MKIFQRLLLLSAIPLNRNEKVLLESLIMAYGEKKKLSSELLELIGIENRRGDSRAASSSIQVVDNSDSEFAVSN